MATYLSSFPLSIGDRDHIRGSATAPVILLQYGDYACPRCSAASVVVEAVRRRFGDALSIVYRHFPRSIAHPHSEIAAEAAEAAGAQDRFWAMHDLLYANPCAIAPDDLTAYAEMAGLDLERFNAEMARRTHFPRVCEDYLSGVRSGVNRTPAFYVNEVRYRGPHDLSALSSAIAHAVKGP